VHYTEQYLTGGLHSQVVCSTDHPLLNTSRKVSLYCIRDSQSKIVHFYQTSNSYSSRQSGPNVQISPYTHLHKLFIYLVILVIIPKFLVSVVPGNSGTISLCVLFP